MFLLPTKRCGSNASLSLYPTEDHGLEVLFLEAVHHLGDHHGEAGLGMSHDVVLGKLYLWHSGTQSFRILLGSKGWN